MNNEVMIDLQPAGISFDEGMMGVSDGYLDISEGGSMANGFTGG